MTRTRRPISRTGTEYWHLPHGDLAVAVHPWRQQQRRCSNGSAGSGRSRPPPPRSPARPCDPPADPPVVVGDVGLGRAARSARPATPPRAPAPGGCGGTARPRPRRRPSDRLSTTPPSPVDRYQKARVTHPFHPLVGRDYEFVEHKLTWGEDRVWLRDEDGRLFSLLAGWTDAVAPDPFTVFAAGRCPFTTGGLLALSRTWLARLPEPAGRRRGCKGNYAVTGRRILPLWPPVCGPLGCGCPPDVPCPLACSPRHAVPDPPSGRWHVAAKSS